MMIKDIVHGAVGINDRVIEALIASKAFQRLKGIGQQGVPEEYLMPGQVAFPRYDHCVGAMLILRRLNASLEEQVAGLLHDVSHTAFSHVVDYVFGGGNREDYQDSVHHVFFGKGTELYRILTECGLDPEKVSKLDNYSMLEQEQPEMCADRFDYTVRYWAHMGDNAFVKDAIASIGNVSNLMVFDSEGAALRFARMHMVWQPEWKGWGGAQFDMRVRWYIFGEALRIGIDSGIINRDDFLMTDAYVLNKLHQGNSDDVNKLLGVLKKPLKFTIEETSPKVVLRSKFRYVDPKFTKNGEILRLSEVDGEFLRTIEEHRRLNALGVRLGSIEGLDLPIKRFGNY